MKGHTPARFATFNGNADILHLLLKHDARFDTLDTVSNSLINP